MDDDTYNKIRNSEFIQKEFGGLYEDSTTTEEGETYRGGYLIGRKSYIEFFNSQGLEGAKEGTVGIGFSTQREGDLDIIYNRFNSEFGDTAVMDLREFVDGEAKYPWFYAVSSIPENNTLPFTCWVMEMHPLHLKFFGAIPDSNGIISREAYWDAVNKMTTAFSGKPYIPEKCFDDIIDLNLVLTKNELDHFEKELSACGYIKSVDSNITIFSGPGVQITVEVTDKPTYRISSLMFTLENPLEPINMSFGKNAKLSITSNGLGEWQFGEQK
ncbi:MAG: hypothetical protein DRQ13_04605 [Ignavibacteriae bacterium]|nr:MAG: hypothetical protein DRQ13_04605 [Ignavibacteriota bacterium]